MTVKLLIFPFTCLLAIFITRAYHFKKKIIILFRHTHLLIIGKFISQYTHFHPIMQCYKQRAAQRKIRNVFCLGEPQLMIEKWCVTQLCHYITSLHLQLLWTLWEAVQAKNSIKTTALTQVLYQSHNRHHKLRKGRKERSTKENKGKLHDANIGAAAVGKKAYLGMKQY